MPEQQPRIHEPGPHPLYYDTVIKTVMEPLMQAYDLRHEGSEVLREIEGPVVLAPVHRSMLDIPAVAVATHEGSNEHIHFMAKKELWLPVLGKLIERGGGFKIDRDVSEIPDDTMQHVSDLVDKNAVIGIFPEGTRQSGDQVNHRSLKKIISLFPKFGLPVIPVGIAGTEKGDRRPIAVVFGDPIQVEKVSDNEAARAAVKLRSKLAFEMQLAQYRAIDLRRKS